MEDMKLLTARTQEFIEASEGIIAHSKGMDDRMWKAEYLLEVYKVEQLTQCADALSEILETLRSNLVPQGECTSGLAEAIERVETILLSETERIGLVVKNRRDDMGEEAGRHYRIIRGLGLDLEDLRQSNNVTRLNEAIEMIEKKLLSIAEDTLNWITGKSDNYNGSAKFYKNIELLRKLGTDLGDLRQRM